MTKPTYTITAEQMLPGVLARLEAMIKRGLPAGPVVVTLGRVQRTLPQNDHLHPVIRTIYQHMEANGAPKRTEPWWKSYFVAKFLGQEAVNDPAGDGVLVMNKYGGTSDLDKEQAALMLDWLYAFGSDIGVEWPAAKHTEDYPEAQR